MKKDIDSILAGQISDFDRMRFAEASEADGWERIDAKIKARQYRRRRRISLAAAACAAALIVAAVVLTPNTPAPLETAEHILPGRERAVLILESGEQIALDNAATIDEQRLEELGIACDNSSLDFAEASAAQYVLYAPRGGIFNVTLSDGTIVTLNSDTRLTYPGRFSGEERCVKIEGEAYFAVAHDAEHPFVVDGGGMTVRVKGTEFNMLAREGGNIETTLLKGSVEIEAGGQTALLAPGWQARLSNNKLLTAKANAHIASSWKDGVFEFNDMPLSEIAEKLKLWYDVDFVFADPALRDVRFTGAFGKNNELNYFLDLLGRTHAVSHTLQGRTITLTNTTKL